MISRNDHHRLLTCKLIPARREEEEEEDVVGLLEAHPRRHPMSGHELSQAVGALQGRTT